MNALTKSQFRPDRKFRNLSEAIQEKERAFWKKESGFYVRLLRQCETLCEKAEAEKYRNLIGQFQQFKSGVFNDTPPSGPREVKVEFNPLNQSYSRREVRSDRQPKHAELKEHYQTLKEEAFQKIGRFFTVKIR